jgi:hypothetical protein
MEKFKPRKKKKPETILQDKIVKMLIYKGWYCKETHGSMYQSGLPDIFCTHYRYGHRWVEVKMPNRTGDVFTKAQHEEFPKLCANGSGVWVLIADTEKEYEKLFKQHNWYQYLEAMR